jgi:hypothetical protein
MAPDVLFFGRIDRAFLGLAIAGSCRARGNATVQACA